MRLILAWSLTAFGLLLMYVGDRIIALGSKAFLRPGLSLVARAEKLSGDQINLIEGDPERFLR